MSADRAALLREVSSLLRRCLQHGLLRAEAQTVLAHVEGELAACDAASRAPAAALFTYLGKAYPEYLKCGNATQFIAPVARQFCKGRGLDIGGGPWPLEGAENIDRVYGGDAGYLAQGEWDFIYSSHCLEHLEDPVGALQHWASRIRAGGVLFLYLPHPDMEYWLPQNCRKHRHSWLPAQAAKLVADVGFVNVLHGERDLAWSFAVVGWKPGPGVGVG